MKTSKQLFPLGIAQGAAFCNRRAERRALATAVREGRHLWLAAPRRYGKTSLVQQVVSDLKRARGLRLGAATADLLLAYDEASSRDTLLRMIGAASRQVIPRSRQLAAAMGKYFRGLRPELSVSTEHGAGMRFAPHGEGVESVVEALEGLDRMAGDTGVRVLLILDEFQQLGTLREGARIEGAIRHAVERARNVSYLFSGSHRHLLAQMFEDSSRPLYHLCERMALERIEARDYQRFLADAAVAQWQQAIELDSVDAVLSVTARHPYYVNRLCSRLWRAKRPPDAEHSVNEWSRYVEEERHRVSRELLELSPNQRAVLHASAESPTDQPRSKSFLARTRLASASAGQAVQVLLERDALYTDPEGLLRVLDPAIQWYLSPARMQHQ